jgi:hypothetical protein
MKLCNHCSAQFSDDHVRCIHCGRRLRSATGQPARNPPDLSHLYHLTDEHPAKVAALLNGLTEAGIAFTLITDPGMDSIDWEGRSAGWGATASVYVDPADRERAEQVHRAFLEAVIPQLAEMERGIRPLSGCCPACGGPLAPSAESCGSCGLVFPEA